MFNNDCGRRSRRAASGARCMLRRLLAAYDPEKRNGKRSARTSSRLWCRSIRQNPIFGSSCCDPSGTQLVEPLEARYRDRRPVRDAERPLAASALADFLRDQPKKLTDLILLADNDREFVPFLQALLLHRSACVDECCQILSQSPPSDPEATTVRDGFWKKQANAAVCLLGFDEQEASGRCSSTVKIRRCGVSLSTGWLAWEPITEFSSIAWSRNRIPSIRQALILALGEFDAGKLSEQERRTLVNELSAFYRNDPDPGVHSAAGWTLHAAIRSSRHGHPSRRRAAEGNVREDSVREQRRDAEQTGVGSSTHKARPSSWLMAQWIL